MNSVRVGSVEIAALHDTWLPMNMHSFIAPHGDEFIARYPDRVNEEGVARIGVTTYLIRSGTQTFLLDTGLGPRQRGPYAPGQLDASLREAGLRPEEIDTVVHSHLHVDHIGWNTVDGEDGNPKVFFSSARFIVQQAEWDHWMRPDILELPRDSAGVGIPPGQSGALKDCIEPLAAAGRFALTAGEERLDQHLTLVSTPGHTPGHVGLLVTSGGEHAMIIGDASFDPIQIEHPDWAAAGDLDKDQSTRTREAIWDLAADEGHLIIAGHWPFPGFGRVLRLDGKRRFLASRSPAADRL